MPVPASAPASRPAARSSRCPSAPPTCASRRAWRILPALCLALGIGSAAAPPPAAGQAPSRQELQQLLESTDAILAKIEGLRGLRAPSALRKDIRPRDAIVRRYLELLRDRYPGPRLEAERKTLVKFALVPAGFPLEQFLGDMAGEQVAAYYDYLKGEIVLADWLPAAIQAPALAHELVHALQDRHLDLRKFLELRPGQSDALMARHALLEGEATAVMVDLVVQPMGLDITRLPNLGALVDQASGMSSPRLAAAPKFLRDQLLFPYVAGTAFVEAFRKLYPWPAFTRVYRDPPRSTEQILHPEKYLGRRDDPRVVLLPDVRGLLGPGWTLVLEDGAGEMAVRGILERFLPEAEARVAAEGWGGDRYHLYERAAGGGSALVLLTAWDAEADAQEFAAAYVNLIPKKYAGARAAVQEEAGGWRWALGGDALLVERRGADVLVLEGVPRAAAAAVRRWIWRLRAAQR